MRTPFGFGRWLPLVAAWASLALWMPARTAVGFEPTARKSHVHIRSVAAPLTDPVGTTTIQEDIFEDLGPYNQEVTLFARRAAQDSELLPDGARVELAVEAPQEPTEFGEGTSSSQFQLEFMISQPSIYMLTGTVELTSLSFIPQSDGRVSLIGPGIDLSYSAVEDGPVFDFSGTLLPGSYMLSMGVLANASSIESSTAALSGTLRIVPEPAGALGLAAALAVLAAARRTRRRA